MGEANRRAIAQGFDDAEHRRLQLNVEQMQRENARHYEQVVNKEIGRIYDRKADVLAVNKHQELIGKDGLGHYVEVVETVYGKASDLIEHQREINETHYVDEPLDTGYKVADENLALYIPDEANKPLVVYDASTNGNVSIEPGVVYTVATEPLTTKKICAGEYEVTRNRDGAVYNIVKVGNNGWHMSPPCGRVEFPTLAAAKAAIPA